jgi:large subunit ribosomal protein L30
MATSKTTPGKAPGSAGGAKSGQLKLTLIKSRFGRLASHKACVSGLGLRRMHHSVVVADTPENRGMINRISYLLRVEQA